MKVKILDITQDPLFNISMAARRCYNSRSKDTVDNRKDFVKGIIKSGHTSMLEMAHVIFDVEGVSRACYDDKTEVLTENGWKLFKDINTSDRIITRNKNGFVELKKYNEKIEYPYNGILHHYKSQNVDLCVTPNHNLFIKKIDVRIPDEYHLQSSESITSFNKFHMTKDFVFNKNVKDFVKIKGFSYKRKNNQGKEYTKCTDDLIFKKDIFLKFLAWYLSDGTTYYNKKENSYKISIWQTKCKKNIQNNTREQIAHLIKNMGFTPTYGNTDISFKNLTMGRFLQELGKSYEKKFPLDIFKEMNREYAKIFIDEYFKGDGSIDKNNCAKIYTSSKVLSDQLYTLIFMAGYTCTKKEKGYIGKIVKIKGLLTKQNHIHYNLNVTINQGKMQHNREIYILKNRHLKNEDYSGKVYCVDVPNHVIFVRRNGIAIWCGNCLAQVSRHRIGVTLAVQSQRYVNQQDNRFVFPPELEYNKFDDEKNLIFENAIQNARAAYRDLLSLGVKKEDARFVLPEATSTNFTICFNFRSLRHFLELRLSSHAQWEVRKLAQEFKRLIMEKGLGCLVEDIKG